MRKKSDPGNKAPEVSKRIPPRMLYGDNMSTMMSSLSQQAVTRAQYGGKHHEGLRRVLGFPVPDWQRQIKWTDEQCERFIQSAYAGIYLGLYVYNDSISFAPALDGLLIDGQQRLHALERYITGDLAVMGPDGNRYRFTELTDEEQAHFYRIPMGFQVVRIYDEAVLRNMYNLLNFGGTPHEESERA